MSSLIFQIAIGALFPLLFCSYALAKAIQEVVQAMQQGNAAMRRNVDQIEQLCASIELRLTGIENTLYHAAMNKRPDGSGMHKNDI